MDTKARQQLLLKYEAPAWMHSLQNIPSHRIKTSREDTPIHRWYLPGVPDDFEIYIKREDLTGCVLTGNKVRGLEFIFGDAVKQGCTSVCGGGPTQSNIMRTMAIFASTLGMQSHFVVYANEDNKLGNNLLQRMAGANRYLIPKVPGEEFDREVWPKVKQLQEKVRKETGENAYRYCFGGPNPYVFGYLKVFDEMLRQDVGSFSDIALGVAGASTTFGIAVGNHLNECNIKVHGLVTGETMPYAIKEMNKMLKYVGLQNQDGSGLTDKDLVTMTEYLGAGYGVSIPEEIEFLKQVAAKTGVFLGPTYSGKAAYHLVKQLNTTPEIFKGKKILFIHTGGAFELFDGRMENAFDNDNNVRLWKDVMDDTIM